MRAHVPRPQLSPPSTQTRAPTALTLIALNGLDPPFETLAVEAAGGLDGRVDRPPTPLVFDDGSRIDELTLGPNPELAVHPAASTTTNAMPGAPARR
jgi:hypothetical protein